MEYFTWQMSWHDSLVLLTERKYTISTLSVWSESFEDLIWYFHLGVTQQYPHLHPSLIKPLNEFKSEINKIKIKFNLKYTVQITINNIELL